VFRVDGQVIATQKMPRTIPFLIPVDETFDVGLDTLTSVNENDYQMPFASTAISTRRLTTSGRRSCQLRKKQRLRK